MNIKKLFNQLFNVIHYLNTEKNVVMDESDMVLFIQNVRQHSRKSRFQHLSNKGKHGDKPAPYPGNGLDYNESRHYSTGDDVKAINWKQSARSDSLIISKFHNETENIDYVIFDQRNTMFFGTKNQPKITIALKAAITAVAHSLNNQKTVQVLSVNDKISLSKPIDNYSKAISFFKSIAKQTSANAEKNNHSLNSAIKCLIALKPVCSTISVISDFYDLSQRDISSMQSLSIANSLFIYQVQDLLEKELPELYPIHYQSLGSDNSLEISNKKEFQALKTSITKKHQNLLDMISKINARTYLFDNNTDDHQIITCHI